MSENKRTHLARLADHFEDVVRNNSGTDFGDDRLAHRIHDLERAIAFSADHIFGIVTHEGNLDEKLKLMNDFAEAVLAADEGLPLMSAKRMYGGAMARQFKTPETLAALEQAGAPKLAALLRP